jgi:hypothetical protein
MKFKIRYGIPKIRDLINDLEGKYNNHSISSDELSLYKKIYRCLAKLEKNPKEQSLNSHKIDVLTEKYGRGKDVWSSYAENNKPRALRIFWVYGPKKSEITILAIEPHPDNDKYARVELSEEEQFAR